MKNKITLKKTSIFLLIFQLFILLFAFLLGAFLLIVPFLSWLGALITAIWCYFSEYLAIPTGILGAVLEIICAVRNKSAKRILLIFAHPAIGYLVWLWFQTLMSV
ncbi:MAG: hypothetical protein IJ452_06080 [Butyricicoccus sp.]|nr:hypothetical protein [Butyricicoccus sp.]MBQ8585832.1 hypothetical protein [Butyricicoccus sp.]